MEARLSKTNALNSVCYHFRGLGSGMNPLDHCHCTFIELMCSFQSLIVHGHHLFLCSTDRVTWVWNVMQVSKLKKLYFRSVLSQTLCNKPSNIISVYTVPSIHENWQRTQHIPHLERRAVSVLHSMFFLPGELVSTRTWWLRSSWIHSQPEDMSQRVFKWNLHQLCGWFTEGHRTSSKNWKHQTLLTWELMMRIVVLFPTSLS